MKKSRLPRRPRRPNTSGGAARAQQPLGHVRHVTFHAAASADVTCRAGSGRGNFIFQRRAVQFSRRAESESGDRFSYSTKVKKSVFARPTIGTQSSRVGTSRQPLVSLGPHPCLLQGEQAALQMILAHFAARAASFLRQGSLPTPGVQLAKHAATIDAARSHRRGFSSTLHDVHLNGCCWPQSWEWLRSNWVAG